jgi:protocatechuate 3,4-dioxygenase beta subunit
MGTTSRRNFLKSMSLCGGGLSLGSTLVPTNLFAGTQGFGLPYYKQGAPFSDDLRRGTSASFTLQGVVYQHNGKTPLVNAVVEMWHCDEQGQFDFSSQYIHRGKTVTDKNGRYHIQSNFPGKHKEKGLFKTSRIYILINGAGHQESFSQLYLDFKGNPFIDNKHWAACPQGQRLSLPKCARVRNQTVITYNHYLTKFANITLVPQNKEYAEKQLRIYPTNLPKQCCLTFGKSQPGNVAILLHDNQGQTIQHLFFKKVNPQDILRIGSQDLPEGVYTCTIFSSRFGDFKRRLVLG